MRLARLGTFHQTRLSFMRTLLRRLKKENWRVERSLWEMDKSGEGTAVYRAIGKERNYSLVCFAHDLDPAKRSDRVIADAWDATFALYDGALGEDARSRREIERLAQNLPKQEKGRYLASELVFSRANKSVRLFEHVVANLASGIQPEQKHIDKVGYLMRTTAVYGNGKFGIADRCCLIERAEMRGTFQAEMLAVWLIRAFSIDYAEQMALFRAPKRAVKLSAGKRRSIGVGNATGLGMAPFLVNHPALLHRWIETRERALASVLSHGRFDKKTRELFSEHARRALLAFRANNKNKEEQASSQTGYDKQAEKTANLCLELERLVDKISTEGDQKATREDADYWLRLFRWAEKNFSLEGLEMLVSLLLEPQAEIVDELAQEMHEDEEENIAIDGSLSASNMLEILQQRYAWCLHKDYQTPSNSTYFWYISEEKLEPRLGERTAEQGAELEQPLAIARDANDLYLALREVSPDTRLAEFLLQHPEHRHIARRVQLAQHRAYMEIQDNLVGSRLYPADMLRCKLSFFGATNFDVRSDRWLRITMYRYAPLPDELAQCDDDWVYPKLAETTEATAEVGTGS